ncbi:hypothetical protein HMPREF0043_01629 [Actinobaculum sp. oral taxon 183 str. F0552]|nr:hypothetical protein HMPREF0043_01629 [Actinobaculum sp. oral taxon 183 str. F0552]
MSARLGRRGGRRPSSPARSITFPGLGLPCIHGTPNRCATHRRENRIE